MRHTRHVPVLALLATALSSCVDRNDATYDAVARSRAALATRKHAPAVLTTLRSVEVDGTLRWTIPTGPVPGDWYTSVRDWINGEPRSVDLQAQLASLAYFELGQAGAFGRAELAAALEKTGLQLQQFAAIDLGDGARGYAVEFTALT